MKMKKIMAAVLAVSVMASVAGCSKVKKITHDDFVNACDKMGAEEVDYDDSNDVEDSDLEDGVYCVMDSDDIEDVYSQYDSSSSAGMYGMSAPDFDSVIEAEDMQDMTVFAKMDQNIDDISDAEDLSGLEVNAVIGVHITLTEADMAEEIMGNLADLMDDLDVEVDDLSSDEYYTGKNEGYLKFDIDAEDLIAAFLESETCGYLEMMDTDVEEYVEGLEGCVGVAVYISGENMVIVMGAGVNNAPDYLDEFCGDLGIASPSKLESNAMIAQAICDYVDDTLGSMLSSFAALATSSSDF